MKRLFAGVLVTLPLFIAAMPKQASAEEIIIIGGHHTWHRWIPGHWDNILDHHRWFHVWIPGHYER